MESLTFVTGNNHKFAEVQNVLHSYFPNLKLHQSKEHLVEIQADTIDQVAVFKVNSVLAKVKPPFFIEDAGFFVEDHLHGFPGVYSSYVMKTIGYKGILNLMKENLDSRKAHFEAVIAYCDINKEIRLFKGINEGVVAMEARGSSGFGFDPIFISKDFPTKTFAELEMEEKNRISHRFRALEQLINYLKNSN